MATPIKLSLVPAPEFWAPAGITVPGHDQPAEIKVQWRYKTVSDYQAWLAGAAGRRNAELLAEIIADWEGPDLPYGVEALDALLDAYPAAAMDLFGAYGQALFESRRKN